ncbi:MAG TPA: type III secretion system export apparatus subunit SctU [Geminicoccaceae bacterium]|nr:type III secretion system export apparatus subunit SctU [Geminicoccaceae bacterium]
MSDKTEPPTPKKLRDARKKGNVAHSKEVVTTALTLALFGYFWASWSGFVQRMQEILVFPPQFYRMEFRDAIAYSFDIGLKMVQAILVPVIVITIVVGILANMVMVGVLFAFESIKPSLDKVNPASGIKKIFGMKNLVDNAKSIVKTVFLSVLLYILLKDAIGPLVRAPVCGLACLESVMSDLMRTMVIYVSLAFFVLAAADYGWQKFKFTKDLKMSKDEVKREYKESEGDPHIKSKRKQLAQELVMSDQHGAVKNASVVVTNPTHLAVALLYDKDKTPLPMVVAKGENLNAERIIKIAQEAGVPIMRNVDLAHALYDQVETDRYIPSELVEPVAEVLRWVRSLSQEPIP